MNQLPCRARDLGIVIGAGPAGPHNAITDVNGIRVGHTTLDDGADLHTGVTAVVPPRLPVPAAIHTGNGYGKLVGSTQVNELGILESPVVFTATLSVFRAADAVLTHLMRAHPEARSFNPLVGETNDGFLSDVRRRPITERHVLDAIEGASGGPVAEGCVGAGTGTTALGFKAGIGTASRVVGTATVGVLVQANFGGVLTVQGVRIPSPAAAPEGNSCMIVLATDAGLDSRQLGRLARRAIFAMGRVGASFSHGSGDYAIAFSTASSGPSTPDSALDPLFAAVMDGVEEALLNSLFTATTTTGVHGRTSHAVPHELVSRIGRAA